MATLSVPGAYGSTLTAQAPDGSFVSAGNCPPGYAKQWMNFSGKWQFTTGTGTVQSGTDTAGAGVCIPLPPAPAPAAQITTTVSPNIAVSPQVSPIFQQQFQPSNSPATAGTTQISPAVQASPTTQQTPLPSGSQEVAASAPPVSLPPQLPVQSAAPAPTPYSGGGFVASPVTAPADTSASAVATPSQNPLTNYWPWIIGIGIVGFMALSKDQKRRKVYTKRK